MRESRGPGSGAGRATTAVTALGLVALALAGCAPMQVVRLEAEPPPDALYVDGQLQAVLPREIELRADQHHTLYFKKQGYRAELVVLEPTAQGGETRLEPGVVKVRLQPVGARGRAVEIDLEEGALPDAPGGER